MNKRILFLLLLCSLFIVDCSKPRDPVDRFIVYMNKRLDILEKYKDDPEKAGIALDSYNRNRENETNELSEEQKEYNKTIKADDNQETMERIKPVVDRMIKLISESPTLLLNENVARAFAPFDLGL